MRPFEAHRAITVAEAITIYRLHSDSWNQDPLSNCPWSAPEKQKSVPGQADLIGPHFRGP